MLARESSKTALRIATEQSDRYGQASALTGIALHARADGDYQAAIDANAEVRAIAHELENEWLEAWADNHDSLSLIDVDIERAEAAAEASLVRFRALGDRRATGWSLTALAQIAHTRGDHEDVIKLARDAATLSTEVGDGRNAAWAMELAASSARASGDDDEAARFESDAASLLRERGMAQSPWRRNAD